PKPETRNPKPETRNPKPETRNPKPETRNPKPETQEGKDVLDDLREMKLINTIKLSTADHGVVQAYQVQSSLIGQS
ncbi:hypothetical protein T484DRAFT_1650595, partial [Baffinella frigidus]